MTQPNSDLVPDTVSRRPDTRGRHVRLREFQAQLVERMQAVRSGAQQHVNRLGVMIGGSHCMLNLQEAGEIVSVGAITDVPLTQSWFLGLTNIRGNLVSVVDFANYQGMAPTPINKDCRIVAFSTSLSFNCGLLVSRVVGLRNITEMEEQPDSTGDHAPWEGRRYLDRESQVWTELNLSLLVQDPRFLHVGL